MSAVVVGGEELVGVGCDERVAVLETVSPADEDTLVLVEAGEDLAGDVEGRCCVGRSFVRSLGAGQSPGDGRLALCSRLSLAWRLGAGVGTEGPQVALVVANCGHASPEGAVGGWLDGLGTVVQCL